MRHGLKYFCLSRFNPPAAFRDLVEIKIEVSIFTISSVLWRSFVFADSMATLITRADEGDMSSSFGGLLEQILSWQDLDKHDTPWKHSVLNSD